MDWSISLLVRLAVPQEFDNGETSIIDGSSATMDGWYVVNTLPHQETRADQNLRRQEFTTLLPVTKRTRRHARKMDTVLSPLFPGYLFVQLDLKRQAWSSINGTFGVKRLLSNGLVPTEISSDFVAALRETIDENGIAAVPAPELQPGQQVRIASGPFADCIAAVMHLSPGERVKLLLDVLGGSVQATIPRRAVVPL
ncbi:MAG: transcriptional activator RfaH [Pseudomonadota bacterium]